MVRKMSTGGLAVLMWIASSSGSQADEAKVDGSVSLGLFSQYVFRGYEMSARSVVFQPSLGLADRGFSACFWGNIDSDEHATQTLTPDRPGRKSFNETDLTLSYPHTIGKVAVTGGYIYYGTKYTAETEELYAAVS